jgi:hypothetical protein
MPNGGGSCCSQLRGAFWGHDLEDNGHKQVDATFVKCCLSGNWFVHTRALGWRAAGEYWLPHGVLGVTDQMCVPSLVERLVGDSVLGQVRGGGDPCLFGARASFSAYLHDLVAQLCTDSGVAASHSGRLVPCGTHVWK